ncbi:hypothetical protein [Telluribacter humicola]|uniref:hypothetical protein n=1 Tax=Telluribacter humicola TaxID=1720261 RepID=UPI001E57EC8F|nr:hypothetical protein [Telluribacter humicola]
MAYYWGSLTLVDQLARTKSGGRMAEAYNSGYRDNSQLKYLFGDTMDYIFDPKVEIYKDNGWKRTYFNGQRASFGFWIKKILGAALRKLLVRLTKTPLYWWQEREAWVYDNVSLSQLMSEASFEAIQIKDYNTSDITDWSKYNFDQSTHGDYAFEPSLFLEGRK